MVLNRKNIVELIELDLSAYQNTKFTCEAKIAEIDTTFGWWYKACYNCKTAVKTYDDTFWCSNYGKNDQSPIPWYILNIIAEDLSGRVNFTVFGKTAQDLIRIPAQNLVTSADADKIALPPMLRTIIGQEHIFQVVPDTLKFRSSNPSFKVLKIFTLDISIKGKSPLTNPLLIKHEEYLQSPTSNKEIRKELFEDLSPITNISSSSAQINDDQSDIQPAKRFRLTFDADTMEENKDNPLL